MRLSTTFMNQLRFNFQKHFIQNPTVKSYTMEALGHKGTQWAGFFKNSNFEKKGFLKMGFKKVLFFTYETSLKEFLSEALRSAENFVGL